MTKDREEISALSALEQDILTALYAEQRDLYGLEIKEALEKVSQGKRKVSFGSLYPALHKLEEKKLIKGKWGNNKTGKARRKYYEIEQLGKELLKETNNYRGQLKNFFNELGDNEAAVKSEESLDVIEKVIRNSNMPSQITEVIGFDLGHGDTAIAKLSISSDSAPEMLNLYKEKKQVTAIGKDSKGKYFIGEQAVTLDGVKNLHINFKEKPNLSSSNQKEAYLKHYMREYYRHLKKTSQLQEEKKSYFVVGCPSGWELEVREKYQKILKIDEICSLTVEPESRAAFLQAKDSGKFTVDELLSPVLIIDIGSSTTDFTLVQNFNNKPIDFGDNQLGASLIDKSILKLSRNNKNNKRIEEVEAAFKQDDSLLDKCELACRKAKEIYFSQQDTYEENPQKRITAADYAINDENDLYFKPIVTADSIQQILDEPQTQLGNKSWIEAFECKITEVRDYLLKKKISLRIIIMTGGASRMQFTRDICRSTFPKEVKFEPDIQPEFSIAAGLARIGRWDLLSKGFKQEVKEFIERGEVRDIIRSHVPSLIDLIVELLKEEIIDIVKADLKAWQERKIIAFKEVEEGVKKQIEVWLSNDDVKHRIRDKCEIWLQESVILRELDKKTQPICEEFRMPQSGLNLQVNIDPEIKAPIIPLQEYITDLAVKIVEIIKTAISILGGIILCVTGLWFFAIIVAIASKLAPGTKDYIQRSLKIELAKNEQALQKWLISTDIPVKFKIREMILPNDTIETLCEEKEVDLAKDLSKRMKENQDILFEDVVQKVGEALEDALSSRAEQAVILIK